jgi:hypothetical protein
LLSLSSLTRANLSPISRSVSYLYIPSSKKLTPCDSDADTREYTKPSTEQLRTRDTAEDIMAMFSWRNPNYCMVRERHLRSFRRLNRYGQSHMAFGNRELFPMVSFLCAFGNVQALLQKGVPFIYVILYRFSYAYAATVYNRRLQPLQWSPLHDKLCTK